MYRHLLVPIDGTELSVETIAQAVEFARTLGARITFFHAIQDHASSQFGQAEMARAAAPEECVYASESRARELLTKAESAARAYGVPCSSASCANNTAHAAIIAAAGDAGCDLIFMASHGRRSKFGMMLGSQTLKVVTRSTIPVLVCATREPAAPARAIGIIRNEHRSLAAVLHATMHLLATARRNHAAPDATSLRAVIRYIQNFPVALHHPKEEGFLFRKLRERTSALDAELDELERQHVRDRELVAQLAARIERCLDANAPVGPEIEETVSHYASFVWEHLGREEGVILPAAQRYLKPADWADIDAAFSANQDPCFDVDTDAEYRQLFSRIVSLASHFG
jgi:nucleotide-binding universal stress UspA family protein/hemerythrin-like domain-containing protein